MSIPPVPSLSPQTSHETPGSITGFARGEWELLSDWVPPSVTISRGPCLALWQLKVKAVDANALTTDWKEGAREGRNGWVHFEGWRGVSHGMGERVWEGTEY